MRKFRRPAWFERMRIWTHESDQHRRVPAIWILIVAACLIGVLAGYGAALFTLLIDFVTSWCLQPFANGAATNSIWLLGLLFVPAFGLLFVSWLTRRFAPEAQGHGVPEVIMAVTRHDGKIRPRVSLVKILASGLCIGTGGSIGREGPIVQIGSSLGSSAGQLLNLSPRHVKVLVAAGAAAGISATFNAPIAGVVFASEIILGSFAVESLTPIVVASVIGDVVQRRIGEHGINPAFQQLSYNFSHDWVLPAFLGLGLICGLLAVGFTKLVYAIEDFSQKLLPKWWVRALVCGGIIGLAGVLYPSHPPQVSADAEHEVKVKGIQPLPPLFGVGYGVVDHTLHLEANSDAKAQQRVAAASDAETSEVREKAVVLDREHLLQQLWWLLPLALLKPLLTSITLAGGGSGGIFAPSLFIGATAGASFGLVCNLLFPEVSGNPGIYAIVGMGAVVAGTTHAILSAVIIVYEMTSDYGIILPIMIAAGLASVVARIIDPDSIYGKKLTRRGESLARGHDAHRLEHVMVRDVMIREFPTVRQTDNLTDIVRIARENEHMDSLPVMNSDGRLVGIIGTEDLHRAMDSDIAPHFVYADDIASPPPVSVSPNENLLEMLRDFGKRDVEMLPVEEGKGEDRRLVGLLIRAEVMQSYRREMLEP
jgi:CIC family chloride channel protein